MAEQPRRVVRALVQHEGAWLLMERWKPGEHYLVVPGGAIEDGEDEITALQRELREECQIEVEPIKRLVTMRTLDYGEQYFWECNYVSGLPQLDPHSVEAAASLASENRFQPGWFKLPLPLEVAVYPHWLKNYLESSTPPKGQIVDEQGRMVE